MLITVSIQSFYSTLPKWHSVMWMEILLSLQFKKMSKCTLLTLPASKVLSFLVIYLPFFLFMLYCCCKICCKCQLTWILIDFLVANLVAKWKTLNVSRILKFFRMPFNVKQVEVHIFQIRLVEKVTNKTITV